MIKRYRYRAYPTKDQDRYFQQIFGTCRFVYNWALDLKIKSYQESKMNGDEKPKGLSIYDISKKFTQLKKDDNFKWLNDVPAACENWALQHLDTAFNNFFKKQGNGFPKFKSKYVSNKTFSYHQGYKISFNRITVPKSGWLKFVRHRDFQGDSKTITVIQEPSGKYYVSIVVDDNKPAKNTLPFSDKNTIGVDVGVVNSITLSNGVQFNMDIDFVKQNKILAKQQQKLSRKIRGSKNYAKQKIRVATVSERIRLIRDYQIKKATHDMIECILNDGYTGIAIRKYDIKSMVDKNNVKKNDEGVTMIGERKKRRRLNKSIMNGAMDTVCTSIKQKCIENGINILEMDANEIKTTGKCFICNSENVIINLNSRKLECMDCGHVKDIDINASKNVLEYCLQNKK